MIQMSHFQEPALQRSVWFRSHLLFKQDSFSNFKLKNPHSTLPEGPRTQSHDHNDICKQSSLSSAHWSHLAPNLLPFKQHNFWTGSPVRKLHLGSFLPCFSLHRLSASITVTHCVSSTHGEGSSCLLLFSKMTAVGNLCEQRSWHSLITDMWAWVMTCALGQTMA